MRLRTVHWNRWRKEHAEQRDLVLVPAEQDPNIGLGHPAYPCAVHRWQCRLEVEGRWQRGRGQLGNLPGESFGSVGTQPLHVQHEARPKSCGAIHRASGLKSGQTPVSAMRARSSELNVMSRPSSASRRASRVASASSGGTVKIGGLEAGEGPMHSSLAGRCSSSTALLTTATACGRPHASEAIPRCRAGSETRKNNEISNDQFKDLHPVHRCRREGRITGLAGAGGLATEGPAPKAAGRGLSRAPQPRARRREASP